MSNVKNKKVLFITQLGIFTALEAIFCLTPLGSLPITPGIVATLAHVPALIAAITLGKAAGLYMGAMTGIFSLIVWTFMPPSPLTAFVFTPFAPNGNIMSLVICLIPRTLFPFIAALIYEPLKKRIKAVPAAITAGAVGSLAHTVMVLGLIFVSFYGSEAVGSNFVVFIMGWAGVNALIEIGIGAAVCGTLIVPLNKVNRNIAKA